MDETPIHADARRVIDWYRARLSATAHDLAFATCALAEAQEAQAGLREEIAQIRRAMDDLAATTPHLPDPSGEAFEAWVDEHWNEIQDARLAHAVRHSGTPASVEPIAGQLPPAGCGTCHGSRQVPDWASWNAEYGEPRPKPCPDCAPAEEAPALDGGASA